MDLSTFGVQGEIIPKTPPAPLENLTPMKITTCAPKLVLKLFYTKYNPKKQEYICTYIMNKLKCILHESYIQDIKYSTVLEYTVVV